MSLFRFRPLLCLLLLLAILLFFLAVPTKNALPTVGDYIKWVDFSIPYSVLEQASALDIKTQGQVSWIDLLALLAGKYGGEFSRFRSQDLTAFFDALKEGKSAAELGTDYPHFSYFKQAYTAVLAEMIGEYYLKAEDGIFQKHYGFKAYSPIAKGFSYSHYDDFGAGRSFGYKRKHLGNDLLGSIGTPIIAVESGVVEALGWNPYGGWRIGIRSLDQKRYYYYAHLRRDHPYAANLAEGELVQAGDVIGYLGMTGYSTTENVNNISTPHLHFGLQLIFDESQKDGTNQIWVDVYPLMRLLNKNKSPVVYLKEGKEYVRATTVVDPSFPE